MSVQESIEQLKAKRDIRMLVHCLTLSPTAMPGGRDAAVAALRELKDPTALKPLFDVLNGGFSVPPDLGYAVGEVLKEYGDSRIVQAVIDILNGQRIPAARAAQALGRMGDKQAALPLVNKLREQTSAHWMSRRDSAEALGALGDKRAVEMLLWVLRNDRMDQVRAAAAIALGLLGDDAAVVPLAELIAHKNKDLRAAVAQGLGELGNPATVEHLLWLLKDKAWEVRAAAAEALGKLKDERAIQPLKELLAGAIPVQRAAIKALEARGQLRSAWPILGEAEAIVGAPVEAAGVFEREVKLKFGGMIMEQGLGCLFSLVPLAGSIFGFGIAGEIMKSRKAKKEGITIQIALVMTADSLCLFNLEQRAGKLVLGRRFAEWKRAKVTTVIETLPNSFVQILKITHDNESLNLIPKEDPTSPGAFLKVISLLGEK